ncbi:hypothetical protein ACFQ2B_07065 [Streptomyces stramineus]
MARSGLHRSAVDWAGALLDQSETAEDSVLRLLKKETLTEHRRRQPIWTHRTAGQRTRLLDQPIGSGLVLADLLTDGSSPEDTVLRTAFADRRVIAVLRELFRDELTVAHDWAETGDTWRRAALAAGLPAAYGERVRRKLKRLGTQHAVRAAAAAARGTKQA